MGEKKQTLFSLLQEVFCVFNVSGSIQMSYDRAIVVENAMCFQEH